MKSQKNTLYDNFAQEVVNHFGDRFPNQWFVWVVGDEVCAGGAFEIAPTAEIVINVGDAKLWCGNRDRAESKTAIAEYLAQMTAEI